MRRNTYQIIVGILNQFKVSSDGGSILIHAVSFYAVNGIESTEGPYGSREYEFIGENQPLEFSWTNGNKDDSGGNISCITSRTRDEDR